MPRPRIPGSAEPKKRSRAGCWPCKARKVKCDEDKPQCQNCVKQGETCDYSIRLNWHGRSRKSQDESTFSMHAPPLSRLSQNMGGPANTRAAQVHIDPRNHQMSSHPLSHGPLQVPLQHQTRRHNTSLAHDDAAKDSPRQAQLPSLAQISSHSSGWSTDSTRHFATLPTADSVAPTHDASLTNSDLVLPPLSRPDFAWSSQHAQKRLKLSPMDPSHESYNPSPAWSIPRFSEDFVRAVNADAPTPTHVDQSPSGYPGPVTPSSTKSSEDVYKTDISRVGLAKAEPFKVRRLSVNSLLSGPSREEDSHPNIRINTYRKVVERGYIAYGYDYGRPDLDIPRNDDKNAIAPQSPSVTRVVETHTSSTSKSLDDRPRQRPMAFEPGGYYAHPVQIKIPPHLEPLPHYLVENPMNLLYFHHFINHTAKVLVPLDCPENPLGRIIPQMACRNANIMNLLLSYSASHRARLLEQPEPANRIALWVRDVFPDLRAALSSPAPILDETLATAIMLASLEIISPNAFGVAITWQSHLHVARSIIKSKGGIYKLSRSDDESVAFLCKWFTYLDVLGSLSGGNQSEVPMSGESWEVDEALPAQHRRIDCFLGCTSRCISLLARVARLGAECDSKRLDGAGNIRPEWNGPGAEIETEAAALKDALMRSLVQIESRCVYRHQVEDSQDSCSHETQELFAANEMFHWAGLIHLDRRVLGRPTTDAEVQSAVRRIVFKLDCIGPGSTTAASVIFPLFTAGCDTIDKNDREKVMARLKGAEGWGMTNVAQALRLMQEVWDSGKPWETLVAGEFFG